MRPFLRGEAVLLSVVYVALQRILQLASLLFRSADSKALEPSGSPDAKSRCRPGSQSWSAFVKNHARSLLACDFFVTVTARFRKLYVFAVLDVGTRRILHWNVTDHPTAEWTAQQFRMVVTGEPSHRFVTHDHDCIYSAGVDRTIAAMGLTALKTPERAPQANAFCERLIGTIRRECLDFVIPLDERHVWRAGAGRVGASLQSRTSTRESRARHPRSGGRRHRRILQRSSDPRWLRCCRQIGARRPAPRIPA
jgi:transposase InsO family protein